LADAASPLTVGAGGKASEIWDGLLHYQHKFRRLETTEPADILKSLTYQKSPPNSPGGLFVFKNWYNIRLPQVARRRPAIGG